MRIKALVDSLISIGSPVTHQEHLDVILEGLPDEYQPIVTAIESRLDTYSLSEIELLLTTHECRLERTRLKSVTDSLSVNVAQMPPPLSRVNFSSLNPANQVSYQDHSSSAPNFGFRGD